MTAPDKRVVMVAAVADNGVIGADGDVPWSLPEDLRHFRAVTRDNTVVMGRKTFDSIGHPLPYRTNIVLTRQPGWHCDGVFVARDIQDAIAQGQACEGDIMIIGGAAIYEAAMPYADQQILTEVHTAPHGDTFYPAFDRDLWVETEREPRTGLDFVWLDRVSLKP